MKKLLAWLSVVFSTLVPIFIVLHFNLVRDDGSWNVGVMAAMLLFVIFYFSIYKKMNEKIHTWEIQGEYDFVVENYKHFRTIFAVGILWIVWISLNANYQQVFDTFAWVMLSLLVGLVLKNISMSME